jgi:hypothetical protein
MIVVQIRLSRAPAATERQSVTIGRAERTRWQELDNEPGATLQLAAGIEA